jgi:hypothetical protein
MVDNVDNRWWITHAGIVYIAGGAPVFTHGKRHFSRLILQEFLLEKSAIFRGCAGLYPKY